LLVAVAMPGAACDLAAGSLTAQAADQWTRTYPLQAGGELHIGNTNGLVEIEGVDGTTLDVRAERIAHATRDAAARSLLPQIVIEEQVTPTRVSIETGRIAGLMIGAAVEVRYHVRAPRTALLRVATTNGRIALTGMTGSVTADTTNGGVVANDLRGGIHAHATNGAIQVGLAAFSRDPIDLHTTNGAVTLSLPEDAKADVSASVTNGGIDLSGLNLERSEESRRRVVGRLNGGGAAIDLTTTNGGIRVRAERAVHDPASSGSERR